MMLQVGRKRFWLGLVFSFVQFSFFLCSPVVSTMGVFCLMGGLIDGEISRWGGVGINRACGQQTSNRLRSGGVQSSNRLRSGFVGFSFRWIGGDFVCADLGICGRQGGLGLIGGCQVFWLVYLTFGWFLCLAGGCGGGGCASEPFLPPFRPLKYKKFEKRYKIIWWVMKKL